MKEYCSFLDVLLNHLPAVRPPSSPAAASKQGSATSLKMVGLLQSGHIRG